MISMQTDNDPYYELRKTKEVFGDDVPHLDQPPALEDFDLPDNYEEVIRKEQKTNKDRYKSLLLLDIIIFILISRTELVSVAAPMVEISILLLYFLLILLAVFLIIKVRSSNRLEKTKTGKKYIAYSNMQRAYNYWRDLETVTFWDRLNGYQFEHEVATVFRNAGYDAEVTKGSGDGGVDIILTDGDEKIAVQCKAHSNPVGPSVIRDLYGTMTSGDYTKAILVSKNGFTKGVYEFAMGKPIELLSLNDILEMVKEQ